MKSRPATVAEKIFMDEICQLGCIVCFVEQLSEGDINPEVTPHHMEGKTKPGAHFHVIPLCGKHHQIADTDKPKNWISRHGDGKAAFEKEYGSEMSLHHKCLELMNFN